MAAAEHAVEQTPNALWSMSAVELGRAYKARELSPVDVLDAVLARCESINPRLNAIVTFDIDGARRAPRASEARWHKGEAFGSARRRAADGQGQHPWSAACATTWGSRLFADHVPAEDELPVARLRAQGAVILGKTNVPEFTLHGYTHNALFGTTRNPWDPRLTPGGSSGGAVAAVARRPWSARHRHRRRRLDPPSGRPRRARRSQAFDRARRARQRLPGGASRFRGRRSDRPDDARCGAAVRGNRRT